MIRKTYINSVQKFFLDNPISIQIKCNESFIQSKVERPSYWWIKQREWYETYLKYCNENNLKIIGYYNFLNELLVVNDPIWSIEPCSWIDTSHKRITGIAKLFKKF